MRVYTWSGVFFGSETGAAVFVLNIGVFVGVGFGREISGSGRGW